MDISTSNKVELDSIDSNFKIKIDRIKHRFYVMRFGLHNSDSVVLVRLCHNFLRWLVALAMGPKVKVGSPGP